MYIVMSMPHTSGNRLLTAAQGKTVLLTRVPYLGTILQVINLTLSFQTIIFKSDLGSLSPTYRVVVFFFGNI